LWPAATGAGNRRPSRLTSDHYFEAEPERPIRLQVVAGPRSEPANHLQKEDLNIRRLRVLVAPPWEVPCHCELCETAGENVTATKHGFESRWGHTRRWTLASSSSPEKPWHSIKQSSGRSSRTSPSATRGRVPTPPHPSPAPPRPDRIGSREPRTPSCWRREVAFVLIRPGPPAD
jgi:hypothetical protein